MPKQNNKNNIDNNEMPLFNQGLNNSIEMNTNKQTSNNIFKKPTSSKVSTTDSNITESTALTLGAYLQEARNKSEYSLNQVAMITKLSIHYIEAIERNDFNNAPPYIYVRAYVKKLSELYNIDTEKALTLLKPYGDSDKVVSDSILQELEESKQINEKEEKKIVFTLKVTSIIIAVIAIILIIIFLFSGSDDSPKKELPANPKAEKEVVQKNMEKLIIPQTLTPSELKVPESK